MIIHGDCLEVLPTLPAQSVDAVICDPPYGTTACKWDSVIPFEPMWRELKRIIKPRGAIVLFGSQPFTSALVMSNVEWYRHERVWNKGVSQNFVRCKKEPLKEHENIVVFASGDGTYNPQMLPGSPYISNRKRVPTLVPSAAGKTGVYRANITVNTGGRYPNAYINIRRMQQKRLHPTQKPVALLEYLIRTYTNEGDTVLDFAAGSFTTGVACVNTGREFIGIEREASYFEIGRRRIEEAQAAMVQMELVA